MLLRCIPALFMLSAYAYGCLEICDEDSEHKLHPRTASHTCLPAVGHSRPCRRDSCTGPSRRQPPSERCGGRGPSGSLCRVCGHAQCVQSWSRAGPPRSLHTATPSLNTHTHTHLSLWSVGTFFCTCTSLWLVFSNQRIKSWLSLSLWDRTGLTGAHWQCPPRCLLFLPLCCLLTVETVKHVYTGIASIMTDPWNMK